jgi:hypothetical protein
MRKIPLLSAILLLQACSITPVTEPRQYLDEHTTATITVSNDPWTFTRSDKTSELDYFSLFALDVNRQGDHKKYLAVVQYWPEAPGSAPTLELQNGETDVTFEAISAQPSEIGVVEPFDETAPRSAKYWFYAVDNTRLKDISQLRVTSATLVTEARRLDYKMWHDGSVGLNAFTVAAPGP